MLAVGLAIPEAMSIQIARAAEPRCDSEKGMDDFLTPAARLL